MKTLYLIPARGGSKGIPRKNIKPLFGKPLIQYSIDIARKIASDEDICVSTDDKEIISVVENLGLHVPFVRPAEYATDTSSSNDVILHALNFYETKGVYYDVVVLLQPTSPLRTIENVKECLFIYNPDVDMVTTVKESSVSAVLCKENCLGYLEQVIGGNDVRRQDAEKLYEYNGAVYVINVKSIKEKGLNGFTKIKKCVMSEENSVDIDTIMDWCFVETLLEKGLVSL